MDTSKKSWFEERLGLKKTFDWFLYRKVPRGVGWWYVLGSATMFVFLILVFTGIFLMLNYSASPDHAYDSVQFIMTQVTFGSLIRSIHFYAASAMVILIGLHLARVFFMAAYKYPRELTWIIGSLLFILVMGSSFTGYLLPWDQRAYWATNVAAGISGEIPLIGTWVQNILIGGTQIGTLTLSRFFSFHVVWLPALTGLLIGAHIFMVIKQGISAPPGQMKLEPSRKQDKKAYYEEKYEASKKDGESFFPHTVAKDAIMGFTIVVVIIILASVFPHTSEAPADPTSTSYNPRPEWYFFFFFEFLRLFPGWLEPIVAVVIPAAALIILILVPFIDRGIDRFWSQRKKGLATGSLVVLIFIALEVSGAITAPTRPQAETSPLVLEGQKVYRDINCGYCHSINSVGGAIGPDLSDIASVLTSEQITQYLQNPDSMVPNTLHPKLQFTHEELQGLVAYLKTLGAPGEYSPQTAQLFVQICSSCHTLNGEGGNAGPDLSREGSIRSIDFLQSFISDPEAIFPASTMPAFKTILNPQQISDLANYLYSIKGQVSTTTIPVVTNIPSTSTVSPTTTIPSQSPSELYSNLCATCHGNNRQGGLGPALTPTVLQGESSSNIANVISDGMGIMPGYSTKLTAEQINDLVNYLKNESP